MELPRYYVWARKIMSQYDLARATKIPYFALEESHVRIFGLPRERLAAVRAAYRRALYQRARYGYASVRQAQRYRDLSPEEFEAAMGRLHQAIVDVAEAKGVDEGYVALGNYYSDSDEPPEPEWYH